jgi:hypothetical protein
VHAVKHIQPIAKVQPSAANAFEDAICGFVTVLNTVITAFSGTSPFTQYLSDKCAFIPRD